MAKCTTEDCDGDLVTFGLDYKNCNKCEQIYNMKPDGSVVPSPFSQLINDSAQILVDEQEKRS